MNHHSPDVTARDTMAKRPNPSPPPRAPRRPPSSAIQTSTTSSQAAPRQYAPAPASGRSPPRAEVHALQRGRERGREEDREHQTEHAGRLPDVVRGREGFSGKHERVSPNAEPGRDAGDDRRTDALGHEGGDDDHQREERDERLPGERDAAIDELDLEHAFPHPPQEQSFQPSPQYGDAFAHVGARARWGLPRVVGHARSSVPSVGSGELPLSCFWCLPPFGGDGVRQGHEAGSEAHLPAPSPGSCPPSQSTPRTGQPAATPRCHAAPPRAGSSR